MKKILVTAAAFGLIGGFAVTAHATNGMNIEGYGPVALGMGGASLAYDVGTAATMSNPATIGLSEGHRFDIALGFLGPDVTAKYGPYTAESGGDSYYMPAIGWKSKSGNLSYGIGVFGQGGMGTEYSKNTFMAAGSGEDVRSEVSVGRAMIPVAFNVNENLIIGGSADFVWAGMDVKMAMPGDQLGDMVAALGGSQYFGTASGTMVDGLVANIGTFLNDGTGAGAGFGTGPINWARFDFSNDSDFTGEAKGYGAAGKIGVVYKVTPQLTIGATYHTKTALGDLETDNATVSMNANIDHDSNPATDYVAMTIPVKGKMTVKDFEWPETYGIGFAYQVTPRFMVAADIKEIKWSDVMKDFKMSFKADSTQTGYAAGFAGAKMDATLFQDWDDQTVFNIGAAFKATDMITVRAGWNHASNPVPDKYLNALFPAIVEDHITAGLGLDFNESSSLNLAMSFGLETDATGDSGIKSEHSQLSWQLMYTYRY